MAWTQIELDKLDAAIAKGVLKVKYIDREVIYRSLNEMLKIRNEMKKELGQVAKGARILVETSKGIC